MVYLLDTHVFIRAKNLHYGLDFCPAFWEWLIDRNAAGRVFSIEKVGDEVQAIEDDLAKWAADRGPGFFLPPGTSDVASLAAVSAWAGSHRYEPSAVSTFLQVADYYLVAQAHAGKHVVVTQSKRRNQRSGPSWRRSTGTRPASRSSATCASGWTPTARSRRCATASSATGGRCVSPSSKLRTSSTPSSRNATPRTAWG